MSIFTKLGQQIAAPVDENGTPRAPDNKDFQVWMTETERFISLFVSGGGTIYASKAALDADLTKAANSMAWVLGDPVAANNGIYGKVGGSGVGSWTRRGNLPFSFIVASDVGAGGPNDIQATTAISVSSSALIWMNVADTNTASPVTVSFNAGTPLTIKTNSGNDIAAGGLVSGMVVLGIVAGTTFRLLSDQASSSIVAAAEAAQAAAEAAAASINIRNVSSIASLKALNTASATLAFLSVAGREGVFNWRAGDYSALVAADPLEGCYIKATAVSASVGAWVRQDGGWLFGEMRAEWFGVKEGADPTTNYVNATNAAAATLNRAAIQAALNLRYYLRGGVVKLKGFYYVDDFLVTAASVLLEGDVRHSVIMEFGDTTSGFAHPNAGTVIHTYGAGTARLWTDESGNLTDTPVKVAVAVLGENSGVRHLTVQTTKDANAWDFGLFLAGVSNGRYEGVSVCGAWKKDALRLDATWSRTSPNMLATAFLPAWFDTAYKATYDFGLTNNYFVQCRFEGGGAMAVEGGPNIAVSINGISDTVFIGCQFYNDQSAVTKATRTGLMGHLIRLNYRMVGLGGAQGLSFIGCRFDVAARWAFDFDYWSNVALVDRCFTETSSAYLSSQTADGAPTAQLRGRIRMTTNTCTQTGDVLRFCGEFFCNIAPAQTPGADDGSNTTPITFVPSFLAGRKLVFETGSYTRGYAYMTDGEVGNAGLFLRSFTSQGKISLQNMNGGLSTWGYLAANENSWGTAYDQKWGAGTVTFQRNLISFLSFDGVDVRFPVLGTTAVAGNLTYDAASFRMRVSTSSERYKADVEPADFEVSKAIVLGSKPVWYRSTADGDNSDHSFWGFIAEQVAELDPRMVHWKTGETVYRRFVDLVLTGDAVPVVTWPARHEDDDEAKPILIDVGNGQWVPLLNGPDRLIEDELGYYMGRVEPVFVPYEKPKPDGVQYERYSVHEVAMIQKLWEMVEDLNKKIESLDARK